MYILGIHTGHDSGAALFKDQQLVAFCKEERITRIKNDGGRFELQSIDEVLRIAGITRADVGCVALSKTRVPLSVYKTTASPVKDAWRKVRGKNPGRFLAREMSEQKEYDEAKIVDFSKLKDALGVPQSTEIVFTNHHYSHILGSVRFTDWQDQALYISCDGGGDGMVYSAYYFDGESLECLQGDRFRWMGLEQRNGYSIGRAYSYATEVIGFRPNRHEGKITGLAAFGSPVAADTIFQRFQTNDDGSITSDFDHPKELREFIRELLGPLSREDAAASIQQASERILENWVKQLLKLRPIKYVGMSGGVFANVKLNQTVASIPGIEEVFVFPAMGDEGLPVGNVVDALIRQHGLLGLQRDRLQALYYGYAYSGDDLMRAADASKVKVLESKQPAKDAADLLAEGQVGAIFFGGMEMGPRALGARSILASPARRDVNDSINARLERTEFMPFAPYVCAEDASAVFVIDEGNRHACEFMTITTDVRPEWEDIIPAVVHVDKTARPQIISRDQNWLYYDILQEFKAITKIPCLVNTSFNAHEEPIINTPEEALGALYDNRVDFLVCDAGLILRN